jgi:hypothetical protein
MAVAVVLALTVFLPGGSIAGQVDRAASGVAGAVYGALAGVYITTGIYVTKARYGSYIFSLRDLLRVRPETVPVVVSPLALSILGATEPERLGRAALYGGVAFVTGAVVGFGIGHLLGDHEETRWAGGIIGSAVGLLAGTLVGALQDPHGPEDPGSAITLAIPIGIGGGR